jgi:hypothetical protein
MTIFQSALPVCQLPTKLVLAVVEILRLVLGEGAISGRPTSAKLYGRRVSAPEFCYTLALVIVTFFDCDICTEISIEFELCFELAGRTLEVARHDVPSKYSKEFK